MHRHLFSTGRMVTDTSSRAFNGTFSNTCSGPLGWVDAVEIERQRINELKLFVILEQFSIVDPGGCVPEFPSSSLLRRDPVGSSSPLSILSANGRSCSAILSSSTIFRKGRAAAIVRTPTVHA